MIIRHNFAYLALVTALSGALLLGCSEDRSTNLQDSLDKTSTNNSSAVADAEFAPIFDPENSIIPYPNDLLFSGTTDYTLNIPYAATDSDASVKAALNALDGFSTVAPLTEEFGAPINPASLTPTTVRVFEMTVSQPLTPASVVTELTFGVDYVATATGATDSTLAIIPLKALKPETMYMVVLTNGIQSKTGVSAHPYYIFDFAKLDQSLISGTHSRYPALTDKQAFALEPVRVLTNLTEGMAVAYTTTADTAGTIPDLDKANIVMSWTFSTQSVGKVLDNVYTTEAAATPSEAINPTPVMVSPAGGNANIYVGTLNVPYYLTAASDIHSTDPISTHWQGANGSELTRYNTTPIATSTQTIPVLLSVPNANTDTNNVPIPPMGGWPVVIFQHGITGNRTNMLAIADSLAQAGFAVMAIDLPLHGLKADDPTFAGLRAVTDAMGATERTFDLDVITQDATTGAITAFAQDGITDSSGSNFINLQSLLTSRDNVRQGVSDLFTLTSAIPSMSYDGVGGLDFNKDKIYFVGHSLGGIVGSVFLAKDTRVRDAVLAMPGGGIAKLLDGSPTFGPAIASGLASFGIAKGSAAYESFLGAAQTVMDSADPLNYASATPSGRGLLLFEVVGDGANNLPDQVIPNTVWPTNANGTAPSPTAGTTPLALAMGLTQYGDAATGTDLGAWVEFSAGTHSSLLDPSANATVTTQMQQATSYFLGSDGSTLNINSNSGVIVAP